MQNLKSCNQQYIFFKVPLHKWYFAFLKYSILILICLTATNLSLFADYKWNDSSDYLLLNSCAAVSIFLNKSMYSDSIRTDLQQISPKMISLDKTAIDNCSPTASKISDFLLTAQVLAPYLISVTSASDQKNTEMLLYTQAFVVNNLFTTTTKMIFKRKRPYVYNQLLSDQQRLDKESQYSFVSGHSSHAFLSAMFVYQIMNESNDYKKNKNWINAGLFINAGSIAYLRYHAGKHFPTDIICGSLIGAGIGYIIPNSHENKSQQNNRMIHFNIQF